MRLAVLAARDAVSETLTLGLPEADGVAEGDNEPDNEAETDADAGAGVLELEAPTEADGGRVDVELGESVGGREPVRVPVVERVATLLPVVVCVLVLACVGLCKWRMCDVTNLKRNDIDAALCNAPATSYESPLRFETWFETWFEKRSVLR